MASKTLTAPLGHRALQGWKHLEPGSSRPTPGVLMLLVARWVAQSKAHGSLLVRALQNVHATGKRAGAAGLPVTAWSRGKVVAAHPSERAGAAWQDRRVRHRRVAGVGAPSIARRTTSAQSNLRRASGPGAGRHTQASSVSAIMNRDVCSSTGWPKRRPQSQRQKPGRGAETRGLDQFHQCSTIPEACSPVSGTGQNPGRAFSNKDPHSRTAGADSGENLDACAHWCHTEHRASCLFHFQRSPSCLFIMCPWAEQRLTWDNLRWLRKCWEDSLQAALWPCGLECRRWTCAAKFSSSQCWSVLARLCCTWNPCR